MVLRVDDVASTNSPKRCLIPTLRETGKKKKKKHQNSIKERKRQAAVASPFLPQTRQGHCATFQLYSLLFILNRLTPAA
jgi:hypothetical protein